MAQPTRVEWHGREVAKVQPAASRGLRDWADLVYDRSQDEVPVDTGDLRSTAKVSLDESSLEAAVSYDGVEAPIQHERLDYHHENGNAKFLENPLNASRGDGLELLAAALRDAIGN